MVAAIGSLLLSLSMQRLTAVYQKVLRSFALPSLKSDRLLILIAPGDEAAAALGASFLASMVVAKLSDFAQKLHGIGTWIETTNNKMRWLVRLAVGIPVGLFAACSFYHGFRFPDEHVVLFLLLGVAGALVAHGFLLKAFDGWGQYVQGLYALFLLPILLLCALFSIPFGIDAACVAGVVELVIHLDTTWRVGGKKSECTYCERTLA